MEHSDILGLDSKRHVKMWLLHKRGLSRRQIADLLGGTNPGAVGNELKKYEKDPNRQWAAGNYLGAVVTVKDSGRDDMGDFIKSFAKEPTKQVNKGAAKKSGADSGFKVKLVLADDGRKKGGKWIKKIVAVRAGRDILVGHLKKDSEWYSPNERSRVSTHVRTVYKWGWDAAGLKELFGFDVKPVYRFSRLRHDGRTINDGESTSGAPAAIRFKEILEEKMKEFAAEETPSALEKGAAPAANDDVIKEAAKWIIAYSWHAKLDHMPSDAVQIFLSQFKPKSPITLYRFEHPNHDREKRLTSKNIPLQSWTRDKDIAQDVVNDNDGEFVLREQTFKPDEIFTDFTLFSDDLLSEIKGRDSGIQEVLVWYHDNPSALAKGAAVEAEHSGLYDKLAERLKEKGVAMPISREEFFKEIAREHLAEKKDYYDLLEKYVEKHTPAKPAVLDYYSFENQKIDLFNSSFEKSGASGRAKKEEEAINKTFGSGAYEKFQAFRSQYLGRFTSSALMSEDGPDYYKNADEHAWYEILGHYYKQYKDSLHAHSEKHTPAKPNKNFRVEIEFSSSVESQLRTAILSYLPQLVKSIAEKTPDASEKINVDVRKEGSLMHHITEYFVEITPLYGLWARLGFAANRGARGSGGYTKVVAGASVYKRGGSDVEYLDLTYYEEPDYEAEDTKGNREVYEKNKSQKYRGMDEDRGLLSYLLNWAAARIPASGKSMGRGGKTEGDDQVCLRFESDERARAARTIIRSNNLHIYDADRNRVWVGEDELPKILSLLNEAYIKFTKSTEDELMGRGGKTEGNGTGAEDGGLLVGVKHTPSGAGINVQTPEGKLKVEGGEIIINAAASKKYCKELSEMNQSVGDGVAFPCDHPALDGVQGPMAGKGAQLPVAEWTMPDAKTYIYAESIRKNHPEIWRAGGNEFGNTAYENLTRVLKRGYWLKEEEKMYKRWRSFIARHQHDKRLPGVVANLKWLNYPNIGEAAVRELIDDAIKFSSKKPELNGNGWQVREKMMAEYDALFAEVARANDTQQRLRNADGNSMAYRAARMRYMKLNAKRLALLQKIKGLAGHGYQLGAQNADGKKPYYLLSREEVIAERDALEANWENRTPADEQRMKNLQRYSFVAFKTLLSELK